MARRFSLSGTCGLADPSSDKYKRVRQLGLLTTVPMILAAAPLIGYFIGHWIDKRAGTDPWFMLVFLVLGLVAGARETILIIKKAQEDDRDENP